MKNKKNIFQRLGNYLSSKVKSATLTMLPNSGFLSTEDLFDTYNLRTFRESLYLFIGVSMIRETVSSIPWQLYKIKGKEGEIDEVYDDPIIDLFERPNDMQTQKEFMKLAVAYYLLAGETFWYLEREDINKLPTAMVNMRPDCVTILFSEDKKSIIGYEFNQNNGEIVKIRKEDVLHIKNIDPVNPIRGVGVIRPATSRIVTEKEASKHQANTFKNQGRPDIIVFYDEITDEQIEDAQEKWGKKFGKDRGSQLGIFGNGAKSMHTLNTAPKEMDFINTQAFLRDDILAALHIPKPMVTSDDVNLANSKTARINYIKEACLPVLDTFHDVINNKFLNDMDEDRFYAYENPVNEDREILLKEAKELKEAGIITIDEARSLMSYDTIEGGDVLAPGTSPTLTMSMKAVKLRKYARQLLKKRPILIKKFKAIEATVNLLEAEKSVKRSRNPVFNTPQLKEVYAKAYNDSVDQKAKGFLNTVNVYNQAFAGRIIKYLEEYGINSTTFFDVVAEINEAKAIFLPLFESMYSKAGQDTLDQLEKGFAIKASEFFFTSEQAKKKLNDRAQFFITSMLNTDYEELKDVITEGLKEGAGVDVIGRNIRKYFDDMSVARAKTIARTETGRLVSQATDDAYSQSTVITGKEWITTGDAKVRDEHQANNGVIVGKGEAFPNGEHYPGEATINCRCVLAPAV